MVKRFINAMIKALVVVVFYALLIGTVSIALSKKQKTTIRIKPSGEMRVNPVINQLKLDLNGYYYKEEKRGSYYKISPGS